MLALARHLNAPTESYDQPDNPVQLLIGRTVARFSGNKMEDMSVAVDGCGGPCIWHLGPGDGPNVCPSVNPPTDFDYETKQRAGESWRPC